MKHNLQKTDLITQDLRDGEIFYITRIEDGSVFATPCGSRTKDKSARKLTGEWIKIQNVNSEYDTEICGWNFEKPIILE